MDLGQYDAIRDSRLQTLNSNKKLREDNKDVLIEIRKTRQAIIENLEIGGFNPIDKDLDKRLNDRLEELKKIFK